MKNNTRQLFLNFLTKPTHRLFRHLLFIVIIFIIALSTFISIPDPEAVEERLLIGVISYFIPLLIVTYLNIYWGTKHYLLKKKFPAYLLFAIFLTFIYMTCLFCILFFMMNKGDDLMSTGILVLSFNLISSFFLLLLTLTGTSTFYLLKSWLISTLKAEELETETIKSEFTYLNNQINPHFLFNTLNNVHVLIKEKKGGAAPILEKLEDLLRYQTTESTGKPIKLADDIQFLHDYLNLEKIRRDNFTFHTTIQGDIEQVFLPPLLLIPFVENAVKHSYDSENPSYVNLSIVLKNKELTFVCINSLPEEENRTNKVGGLGIKNVRRRLDLLYENAYTLEINQTQNTFNSTLKINLTKTENQLVNS